MNAEGNIQNVPELPLPLEKTKNSPTFYLQSKTTHYPAVQLATNPVEISKDQVAEEETGSFWTWVGLGAVAVGAVIAGAVYTLYSSSESEADSSPSNASTTELRDQIVNLGDADVMAMSFHIEIDNTDLWTLYQTNQNLLEAELQEQLKDCFSPDMDVAIAFQKGSLWTKIVIRVKTAWDAFGNRISIINKSVQRQINISKIERKISEVFRNFVAKTKGIVTSPKVKTTFKFFAEVASFASSIASIIGFIDPDHHTALSQMLLSWAGNTTKA